MRNEGFRTLFICISSFHTIEHCWLVESQSLNQETVKKTKLAKECLLGNKVEKHMSGMMTPVAIAGITLGIGMTALPNELSLREMNSTEQLDTSSICEKTNGLTVFGMHPGKDCRNEEETKAIMDKSHTDDDNPDTRVIKNSKDEKDNVEFEKQPPKSDSGDFGVLITQTATIRSIEAGKYAQIQTKKQVSIATTKRRKLKLVACIVTVSLLAVCLITAGISIIENKIMEIDQLTQEKHSMKKTIDKITEEKHSMKETIDKITEEKHSMEEQMDTLTKIIANMTEKQRMEAGICQPYENTTEVCSELQSEKQGCQLDILACIHVALIDAGMQLINTTCMEEVGNQTLRNEFFEKFGKTLNKELKSSENGSTLNCENVKAEFRKVTPDIVTTFGCDCGNDEKKKMEEKTLEICNALKKDKQKLSTMCRVQKIWKDMEAKWATKISPKNFIGNLDDNLQADTINCTEKYDKKYFEKYFSSNKTLDPI